MDNLTPSSSSPGFSYSHRIGFDDSYANDPVMIARGIFRDEIRDVLIVLKNCGVLRTAAERQWCLLELARLLVQLCHGNVT